MGSLASMRKTWLGSAATVPIAVALLAAVGAPRPASAGSFSCDSTGGGEWTATGTWASCNATFPNNGGGNTYDATISGGSVNLTGTDGAIAIGNATIDVSSALLLDYYTGTGGSSLTVGGTLTNAGSVYIGGSGNTSSETLTASGLANTGTIYLTGNAASQASLVVHSAAPGVLTGNYTLNGNSRVSFDSGSVTELGAGASLNLNGANAVVTSGAATTTNSGLATLGAMDASSTVYLENGAKVTTTTGLTTASGSQLFLDYGYGGGSSLTVGGTLTNGGNVYIGYGGITSGDTVTANGLANTGTINLNGAGASQASLLVHSAAPGVLTGAYSLTDNSRISFDSGTVTELGASASLTLNGANAVVTSGAATTTNSALTTLGAMDANSQLNLANGASVATTTGLTTASGSALLLDYYTGTGGSSLTVGGTLTNGGSVYIGGSGNTSSETLTASGLANTGAITLIGASASQASLVVHSAAPGVLTGNYTLNGNSRVSFDSGAVTELGAGASLNLNGANAVVTSGAATTTNSGLATLGAMDASSTVYLENGAKVTTTTGLTTASGSQLFLDYGYGGGSSLTVGGTLTNGGNVYIGYGGITSGDTVTANGLANTGTINLNGAGASQASLLVHSAAPGVLTGAYSLTDNSRISFDSGTVTELGASASLTLNGANAVVTSGGATTTNSALTTLGAMDANSQLNLANGASVATTTGLTTASGSALLLDYYTGTGGSSLTVGGTLTNGGSVYIGGSGNTSSETLTASGLANTGAITLIGASASQASLVVHSAAPGVLTGNYTLNGNSRVSFDSGAVTELGAGASLNLNGANAVVTSGAATTTNSELATLGAMDASSTVYLENGAKVTTTTGLTTASGSQLLLDYGYGGGSSLTVGGTLTNGGNVYIGYAGITSGDTVTANGLANTGTINLNGAGASQASLLVHSAAPGVLTGAYSLTDNSRISFDSGTVTELGASASLTLNGANAVVTSGGATTTNSALTTFGVMDASSQLNLANGASVATTTGLTTASGSSLLIDYYTGTGGSSLTVGGTLTNAGSVYIGGSGNTSSETLTASGLANTGAIALIGGSASQASLVVNGAAGNSGTVNIGADSLLHVTGGNAYTQTDGQTNVDGTLSAATVNNNGGVIQGNGTVNGAVNNSATLAGGYYTYQTGALAINGGLTNTSAGTVQTLIQGTGAGQTSVVNVATGSVALQGGTLNAATSGFSFGLGQSFTVATFTPGSLTGVFSTLASGSATGDGASADLGGGLTLIADYNDHAGNIQLQVVATPGSTTDAWKGGAGTWSTAGGWTSGVPLSYSNVTIGNTASGNVTLNQDATINSLQINSGNTLAYQASTPVSVTVGQGVTVNSGGALTLGTSGDKLSLGGAFSNGGTTTIGGGASIYGLAGASNSGTLQMQGGSLTASSYTNSGTTKGFGTIVPAIANTNLVEANGGTLVASAGIQGATGTVQIDSGATLDLSASPAGSTAGTLTQNGSLKLGSQNITVSQAYANANFGSGNSFNNRAGVTGTGQIRASGDVAQALTGNVTGGTTATPTMTFGNVHVGSSATLNYGIQNTGTTGPSLQGAIQTGVNGGNLTSAALTGTGVTASNWGPVAIGATTASLGVTYAPTSAGALSGQAVHIANNFDNVAGQTLAIGGAAYDYANPTVTSTQPVNLGNYHVGDAVTQQAVSVQNKTVTNASYQEGLNASIGGATTGITTNGGSVTNLAAGSSDSSSLKVGVSTATAGAISGTATLSLASNGAGTSGLGTTTLASQTVNVTGGVYNLASSNTIAPVHLVYHVGDGGGTESQALSITNTAPAGAFSEGLNSSFGAYSPNAGNTLTPAFSGSITNLAAGSTDNSSMSVSVSTLVAGMFGGSVLVNQASNGATTSGLGITALPGQNVAVDGSVTGGVFTYAQPTINNALPVNFGNVRIGSVVANQAISVSNTAPVAPTTELLDGSFVSAPTGFSGSGSFAGLVPGASPNTSIQVGMNTGVAGAQSGSVAVNFVSNGTTIPGDGTTTNLGDTNIAVSGAVYRLASPTLNTASVTLAARVGDAAPSANVSVTNTSPDAYTESLKAGFGAAPSGFANTGSIGGLAAQGTDAASLSVGLASTAVSGTFTGSATVNFVTTGAGTDNAADESVGSGAVALTGKVYQTAAASVTPNVNFGVVHVGASVADQSITVTNTATGALTDVITGGFGSPAPGSPFSTSGTLGPGVAGNGGSSGALKVGFNTSTAGMYSAAATLALASHDADLTDVALTAGPVTLTGSAYDYANPSHGPDLVAIGNVHVGDGGGQVLQSVTVSNATITNASYQEGLNASIGGAATGITTNGGSVTNLAAGSSDSSSLKVGVSTATAGAISGTATLSLASNGAGTSGLGTTTLASQTVNVTGGVYNLASSNTIAPVHLVYHVGDGGGTESQALSITNTAPAGAFSEGLNSSFGAYSPNAGNTLTPAFSGSITNLAAGSTDNSSMSVSVSTLVAGMFGGSVLVNQASNGATTSGLGITALPGQNVAVDGSVTGGVFTYAQPTINNALPVNFGNVRIGSVVANQAISVSNTAPVAPTTELLDGSFVSAPTGFSGSGSFAGLVPGASPNTSIQVGMNTGVAGAQSGSVAVNFVSNGTTIPGDGTTTNLGDTNIAVSGAVYRLASPTLNTASVTLAARVGDAAPSANVSVTNTSPDAYTESLKAGFGAAPSGFANTGSIGGLAAQGTDAASLSVGLASTAVSGTFTGSATVNFVTTGAGTDNAADKSVGSGAVALTGKVYQTAAASVTPNVNFGVVHVGASVADQSITVTNTATGALTDVITGGFGSPAPGSPFSTSGTLGPGVAGNGGSSGALKVGFNTSTAGMYSAAATLALASHDADLTDVALTAGPVTLTGQVNNYAVAGIGKTTGAGSLGNTGTDYVLDFGNVTQGSGIVTSTLFAANFASSLSDLLMGDFSITSGFGDFGLTGFSAFSGLDAGQQFGPLGVIFDTASLGAFSETIDLNGMGYYNGATYTPYAVDATLTIEGVVTGAGAVPEPSTWTMLLLGVAELGFAGYRKTGKGRAANA